MTVTTCDKCGCKADTTVKLSTLWFDLCNDCLEKTIKFLATKEVRS